MAGQGRDLALASPQAWRTPLAQQLDRRQPLHFIGVGGIGMSAIAGILADRGYAVSGSDPRDNAVLQDLRAERGHHRRHPQRHRPCTAGGGELGGARRQQ
jgi:hypothetical protein